MKKQYAIFMLIGLIFASLSHAGDQNKPETELDKHKDKIRVIRTPTNDDLRKPIRDFDEGVRQQQEKTDSRKILAPKPDSSQEWCIKAQEACRKNPNCHAAPAC